MSHLTDAIRALRDGEYQKTLIGQLVPCVDQIRQLNTSLGLRPYRVFMVKMLWTGRKRGDGVVTEASRVEILPVPKVADMAAVQLQLQSIGIDEIGSVQVSEISARYNEFELRGLGNAGEELAANEEFMWEIAWAKDDASTPIRRRFHAQSLPNYNPSMVQWSISLVRASTEDQP